MSVTWDTKKMKQEISIENACKIAGIKVSRNGFIHCPVHYKNLGKLDSNMTNCKIYRKKFVCYACGGTGDIFSLIKEYKSCYEGEEITFQDAARILAEGSGQPESYVLDGELTKQMKINFPVKDEILSVCGIIPDPIEITEPVSISDTEKNLPANCIAKWDPNSDNLYPVYTIYKTTGFCSIKSLYREDKDAFWFMFFPKLKETYERFMKDERIFMKDSSFKEWYIKTIDGLLEAIKAYEKDTGEKSGITIQKMEKKNMKIKLSNIF